jgi:hypothetical protein
VAVAVNKAWNRINHEFSSYLYLFSYGYGVHEAPEGSKKCHGAIGILWPPDLQPSPSPRGWADLWRAHLARVDAPKTDESNCVRDLVAIAPPRAQVDDCAPETTTAYYPATADRADVAPNRTAGHRI